MWLQLGANPGKTLYPPLLCHKALDAEGSGQLGLSSVITLVCFLFNVVLLFFPFCLMCDFVATFSPGQLMSALWLHLPLDAEASQAILLAQGRTLYSWFAPPLASTSPVFPILVMNTFNHDQVEH